MKIFILSLAVSFTLFAGKANAQLPLLDIGMVPLEDGRLEVRMRPDAFFDGLFSSLTVCVRRDEASVATLAGFTIAPPWDGHINLSYSESVTNAGYIYDLYVGFGFSPLYSDFPPLSWAADQEIVLGHFDVIDGPGTFQIVQVCPPNSQGNYYVSLNSEDRTGVVYEISTAVPDPSSEGTSITIFPNPSEGSTQLSLGVDHEGQVAVEVLDAAGRLVQQHTILVGTSTVVLDANTLSAGSYMVRVIGTNIHSTLSWLVERP